jgi:hypothetical protein
MELISLLYLFVRIDRWNRSRKGAVLVPTVLCGYLGQAWWLHTVSLKNVFITVEHSGENDIKKRD